MEVYKYYDISNVGEHVTINGWVSKVRNLGGLVFIDLRNRTGIIQAVVRPENQYYEIANSLKNEYVVKVVGKIVERENKNDKLKTGDIEIDVSELVLINQSREIPFTISDDTNALEDTRLRYRYLDLRREVLKNNLVTRNNITFSTRKFLNSLDFIEVETPILCKSTPEGARDYLVPSRVNKGKFYALPQSPQLFKQLLMVSGMERYFQIAKCFRDEDLRADRQPEFTQIDVEMSFVNEDDVMNLGEKLVAQIFKDVKGIDVELPLMRMKYDDAIDKYGSDKPDLRFEMEIQDITDIFLNTEFTVFQNVIRDNGIINAIVIKNASEKYSRKDLDKLTDFVKTYKAGGLAYLKFNDEVTGSIVKVISSNELLNLREKLKIENNDLVLIVSGEKKIVKTSLGALRCKLAKDLNLIKPDDYKMLWVVDFPSFEWSEEENRFVSCHHPFTMPKDEDKLKCTYNVGLSDDDIQKKFGFFVDALKYGCPPHGGFALGLDRLTMLLCGTENIRDVIAFPKTASATDLMCECPSNVDEKQMNELGLIVKE